MKTPKDFPIGSSVYYERPVKYGQTETFPGTVVGHTAKKVKIKYDGWDTRQREGTSIPAAVTPASLYLQSKVAY